MKPKIIVTRRWPEAVERKLCESYDTTLNETDTPLTPAELQSALQNYDAVLSTVTDRVDAGVFAIDNIRARIVANYGVGFTNIDIEAAKERNIAVTNTPEVLSECTADLAMALMLMVARRAGEGERELRGGNWSGWRPTHMIGSRISGKTLGIVGYGRIGREMARRAHHGFGMQIRVFDLPGIAPSLLAENNATQLDSLEQLLNVSDFVSLHCPGGAENTHLINQARLRAMKSSAYLINTARGEVVDEAALADALAAGEIAGAGLDVFEREPAVNERLQAMENAVLLPHLGSATAETRDAMGFRVVQNIDAFFADREPGDRVA